MTASDDPVRERVTALDDPVGWETGPRYVGMRRRTERFSNKPPDTYRHRAQSLLYPGCRGACGRNGAISTRFEQELPVMSAAAGRSCRFEPSMPDGVPDSPSSRISAGVGFRSFWRDWTQGERHRSEATSRYLTTATNTKGLIELQLLSSPISTARTFKALGNKV